MLEEYGASDTMANITDTDGFVDVTRPEASDLALGRNEVNFPGFYFRQLASRDRFLFNLIAGDSVAQQSFENFKQAGIAATAQGRLTLQSGTAVPSTDQFNRNTLYYTPYTGDFLALWNAAENRWDLRQFTEVSLLLAGAISTNFDIFAFWNGTEVELEEVFWNTDDARDPSTQISQKNGVWVKTSDNRRYLGTIRTTAPGRTEDSNQNRFVWNVQNRVPRLLIRQMLGIGQYFYFGYAWRAANGSTSHRIIVVTGLPQMIRVDAGLNSDPQDQFDRANATCGIGWNATTINSGQLFASRPFTSDQVMIYSFANLTLENGYHYFQLIERGGPEEGFWGEDPTDYGTSGIMSIWEA